MTNVFAHMASLGDVMRGLRVLMGLRTVFVTESHYLLDVLEKLQFDTIYHEHIRTYSLKSICTLVEQYGMEVFDVERGTRYGGNIRAYVCLRGTRTVSPAVGNMLQWLYSVRGSVVAGVSAPGRAATLLNFYGIDSELMPYLAEPAGSLKIGKYMPGSHIAVTTNADLRLWQPDYLVLFAWHYADVIAKRLRAEGVTSKLLAPLPTFATVD
jgi:hypothetical protein